MGVLDDIASATGDPFANLKVAQRCMQTSTLLEEILVGLRSGAPAVRYDCGAILAEVAQSRPSAVAEFVTDFFQASRDMDRKIAGWGFACLRRVAVVAPQAIYAEREYLLREARQPTVVSAPGAPQRQIAVSAPYSAASVLAVLCGQDDYRNKLFPEVLRLLQQVPDDDLHRWLVAFRPMVAGSETALNQLLSDLAPRRKNLSVANARKVNQVLAGVGGEQTG